MASLDNGQGSQASSSWTGALRAIGIGNLIQIALLVLTVYAFGIKMSDRIEAREAKDREQDSRMDELTAEARAQQQLNHERDISIGRLMERTEVIRAGGK